MHSPRYTVALTRPAHLLHLSPEHGCRLCWKPHNHGGGMRHHTCYVINKKPKLIVTQCSQSLARWPSRSLLILELVCCKPPNIMSTLRQHCTISFSWRPLTRFKEDVHGRATCRFCSTPNFGGRYCHRLDGAALSVSPCWPDINRYKNRHVTHQTIIKSDIEWTSPAHHLKCWLREQICCWFVLQHGTDSYIMNTWYVGQACLFSFQPT